ncbi:MAG: quinone-dependent dihydroorotate dehydrogenase [Bacteroidetes bacterium]|jgi:dihydroorotate dehydrogenase|nr:quinone-dependent dihydroorotate dehydrogenase [Bacteroidota bacterium]
MYALARSLLFLLPAETAHHLAMTLLSIWFGIPPVKYWHTRKISKPPYQLPTRVAGLEFANPLGLAAGFDKNARYYHLLHLLGFGFVEIGTVTPRPQAGNPKPRLFRLTKDRALLNRMGFNNDGADVIAKRLKSRGKPKGLIIGGNIGKNKTTPNEEAVKDYLACFEKLHPYVDYFAVNVSSPNTPGLRDLQRADALMDILRALSGASAALDKPKPIFLKIAPDMDLAKLDEMVGVIKESGIAGMIAHNTTLNRSGLLTPSEELGRLGSGGISGLPLQAMAREFLGHIKETAPEMAVISSGGIGTHQEALHRINQGASLIQLWTGFIYSGPRLVSQSLAALAKQDRQTPGTGRFI